MNSNVNLLPKRLKPALHFSFPPPSSAEYRHIQVSLQPCMRRKYIRYLNSSNKSSIFWRVLSPHLHDRGLVLQTGKLTDPKIVASKVTAIDGFVHLDVPAIEVRLTKTDVLPL